MTALTRLVPALLVLLAAGVLGLAQPTFAQAEQAPDFAEFGFPRVTAQVDFTPGQPAVLETERQRVEIPADALSVPARFELLEGDPAFFTPHVGGQQVVATFAFRVTDLATGQRIAAFTTPVQWSITDAEIGAASAVFDTSPANPPTVVPNGVSPGTVTGQTLAHPFRITTVGWLVLNPSVDGAPATLPDTGAADGLPLLLPIVLGIAAAALLGGWLLRRRLARP